MRDVKKLNLSEENIYDTLHRNNEDFLRSMFSVSEI